MDVPWDMDLEEGIELSKIVEDLKHLDLVLKMHKIKVEGFDQEHLLFTW